MKTCVNKFHTLLFIPLDTYDRIWSICVHKYIYIYIYIDNIRSYIYTINVPIPSPQACPIPPERRWQDWGLGLPVPRLGRTDSQINGIGLQSIENLNKKSQYMMTGLWFLEALHRNTTAQTLPQEERRGTEPPPAAEGEAWCGTDYMLVFAIRYDKVACLANSKNERGK